MTAPAFAQAVSAPVVAVTVIGVATDGSGAPLSGVTIVLRGPATYTAVTGANGAYTLSNVRPGLYTLSASKGGYNSASEQDYPVLAGQTTSINVRLEAATLSSIREIGRTSTSARRGGFNGSPAAVSNLDQQAFLDQGQPQVQRVLDQTPGIVIDHPGTNANNAAPGAITFPSIRGGLGFETASLIDGHPLAVGNFGDYVTTFLNSYVLSGVELVKGPGAAAPEVNFAIGGTVNFRTLDPATKPAGSVTLGYDSFGGQFSNFLYTGTTSNKKLGWVLDYAVQGSPGPLRDSDNFTTLSTSAYLNCNSKTPTASCAKQGAFTTTANTGAAYAGNQNNPNYGNTSLVACCIPISQTFDGKTELVKLKYNLSGATSFTASYLGSQTWTDQNGNHAYQYPSNFNPGAAYTDGTGAGGLVAGQPFTVAQSVFFPTTEWEINNEPIFQAEVRSSIGRDNVIARFYGASINRLQYNGLQSPADTYTTNLQLQGTANQCPPGYAYVAASATCTKAGSPAIGAAASFNGVYPVTFTGAYFRSMEEDKLKGGTFEYDHFLKGDAGNVISFALDTTSANTYAYDYSGSGNTPSVPAGSRTRYTTGLLRGIFNVTPKLNVTLSNYIDQYYQRYTSDGGKTFQESNTSRYDGRLGLAFRATRDASIRFSMGSAVAPPYLNLLDQAATPPLAAAGNTFATNKVVSGTLKPETSFGYDLGFDARSPRDPGTVFTGDIYRTNLQNQFLTYTFANGNATVCPTTYAFNAAGVCANASNTTTGAISVPLYSSGFTNLGNSRYEGIEFGARRAPASGLGFEAQGALIRAYPYNVSGCFYSTTVVNGVLNCDARNTNLGVINGINFRSSGTSGSGSFNSVSNHAIPYSQGYGELSYTWTNNARVSFGEQYYGPNNSLNVPAFFAANANFRTPIGDRNTTLSINFDNLFGINGGTYITPFGGVAVPLVNGKLGLTNANVLTPRVIRFSLTRAVGR